MPIFLKPVNLDQLKKGIILLKSKLSDTPLEEGLTLLSAEEKIFCIEKTFYKDTFCLFILTNQRILLVCSNQQNFYHKNIPVNINAKFTLEKRGFHYIIIILPNETIKIAFLKADLAKKIFKLLDYLFVNKEKEGVVPTNSDLNTYLSNKPNLYYERSYKKKIKRRHLLRNIIIIFILFFVFISKINYNTSKSLKAPEFPPPSINYKISSYSSYGIGEEGHFVKYKTWVFVPENTSVDEAKEIIKYEAYIFTQKKEAKELTYFVYRGLYRAWNTDFVDYVFTYDIENKEIKVEIYNGIETYKKLKKSK